MSGGLSGFDVGGGIGGAPPSVQTANPMMQGQIQQYSSLSVEKLQELAARLAGSPQAAIVQRVLQQKLAMPQTAQPQAQQQPQPLPGAQAMAPQMQARGGATERAEGGIVGRAFGGQMSLSEGDPWWTKSEASGIDRGASGFLRGPTAGRADSIQTQAPAGAYVLPADFVSGVGQGSSEAGARFIQQAISTGPWGTPPARVGRGASLPHPVAHQMESKGGGLAGNAPEQVPVMLSHGEFVVPPEDVMRIGGGDLKHGHAILDHLVESQRKKLIKTLKNLPGPVKT